MSFFDRRIDSTHHLFFVSFDAGYVDQLKLLVLEGLAEFETAAAPQRLGAQTLGTLQIFARTLGVSASIPPWLARYVSSPACLYTSLTNKSGFSARHFCKA